MAKCSGCGEWEPALEEIDGKKYCAYCGKEWGASGGFLGIL